MTLQNGFFTATTSMAVCRHVNHPFVYICFHCGVFVAQSQRQTTVRYRVTRERPEAKNWRHQKERVPRPHGDIVSARLKRAYIHTRCLVAVGCGGGNRRERASGREEANSRRVSGGHLRLGHFVLSPCSVFTVVRRRKETTYAPVRSSLYPRGCIVL